MATGGAAQSAVLTNVNGDVLLSVPADVSATFSARTTNGSVNVEGFASPTYTTDETTHKAGTLGAGAATITLTTTNGNLTLRVR